MGVLVKVHYNFDLKVAMLSLPQHDFVCYVRLRFMFS